MNTGGYYGQWTIAPPVVEATCKDCPYFGRTFRNNPICVHKRAPMVSTMQHSDTYPRPKWCPLEKQAP